MKKRSLDAGCIASKAVSEGNLRMWGIALGEVGKAVRPRLVGIIVTHLATRFPVSIDCRAGESKDRADFPEGHGLAKARVAKSQNTSSFGRGADRHSTE